MKHLPQEIMSLGVVIGSGKEAVVYLYNGIAWKIYKRDLRGRFDQNVTFLKENQESGRVPRYYGHFPKLLMIKMEYLEEYECVADFLRNANKAERKELLFAALSARRLLQPNIRYRDLCNFDNIVVSRQEHGLDVKFIEGGKREAYFCQQILSFLGNFAAALRLQSYGKLLSGDGFIFCDRSLKPEGEDDVRKKDALIDALPIGRSISTDC